LKIRLLLDARKLGDGGIGVYLERLIEGLTTNTLCLARVSLTLLVNKHTEKKHTEKGYTELFSKRSVNIVTTSHRPYSLGEFWQLGREITANQWDLFHTPHYPLPIRMQIPSVVTIHDIIHLSAPERWYYPFITGPVLLRSLFCANEIITVSEASRKTLSSLSRSFSFSGRRINLIPNAAPSSVAEKIEWTKNKGNCASTAKKDGSTDGDDNNDSAVRGYPLRERSDILAVLSNCKPHKGVTRIIEAFLMAKNSGLLEPACSTTTSSLSSPAALTLAGYAFKDDGWRRQLSPSLLSAVDNACAKGIIKIYGALPSDLFEHLYQKARLLLVGSTVEGFCIPVLEAHAAGVPVVTTPVPAITELLGKADTVARDFSSSSLADALASAWVSDSVPEPPSLRFSIASVSEQTLRVYESALQIV
jgi:glycosyltransferase involved in cell wall biosynthesis